ncbi:MAG: exodeoxyribonuclease VII small subunit [Lachnospiraceae bacterium]|jgi:exodeoxyribonuclease VII small subunit|nr:exodeoxyribonuclease VII small subunit [Lachnospiraceae bacterium]MCI9341609.1 exodeoxyribonuclease VII small subunit [Lachnospiraceae bacterium]
MELEERELTLEEAFEKLEETIEKLQAEDITLEDSFKEYKQGMEILKYCSDKIDRVEKKVLKIEGNGELNEF